VALGDEQVYVSCGREVCVLSEYGDQQWFYRVSDLTQILPRGDTVYLASWQGGLPLVALDTADGSEQWRFDVGSRGEGVATREGMVYFVGESGQFYGVDAADGTEQWSWDLDAEIWTGPTVIDDTVYLGTETGLHALAPTDGTERWWFETENPPRGTVAMGNTVYVKTSGTPTGTLYALAATDGTERWQFETSSDSPLRMTTETVYVWDRYRGVTALEPADGSVRWQHSQRGDNRYLDGDDETVYVGTVEAEWSDGHHEELVGGDGTITALDASDGTERWELEWNDFITWLGAQNGTIYVLGPENLYAVEPQES